VRKEKNDLNYCCDGAVKKLSGGLLSYKKLKQPQATVNNFGFQVARSLAK
jgi:hypothetical protein